MQISRTLPRAAHRTTDSLIPIPLLGISPLEKLTAVQETNALACCQPPAAPRAGGKAGGWGGWGGECRKAGRIPVEPLSCSSARTEAGRGDADRGACAIVQLFRPAGTLGVLGLRAEEDWSPNSPFLFWLFSDGGGISPPGTSFFVISHR